MSKTNTASPETVIFKHRIVAGTFSGSTAKGSIIQIDGAPHKILSIRHVDVRGINVIIGGKAQRVGEKDAALNQNGID